MTTTVDYLELVYDPLANDLWLDVCQAQRPEIADALRTHLIALGWSGRISEEEDASCVLFEDTLLVYVLNALSRAGWVQQPPVREALHDDLQRTLFRRTRPADVSEQHIPDADLLRRLMTAWLERVSEQRARIVAVFHEFAADTGSL